MRLWFCFYSKYRQQCGISQDLVQYWAVLKSLQRQINYDTKDFNVMKYVPKIIENLAKELGNRITESVTLGHIENYESMFTPQRFIEQIMAFEYLFEKLEPEKAEQRNFHLIDELELMLGVFPDVIAGVRKSTRKIADEIKNLRVDIVHGHAYYYDFANDHNIQYYMLMLDKLIERMNLKLVGFNDEEIKTFCSY